MRGTKRAAWSLLAVYPTVAANLVTLVKGVAPAFSKLRRMMAADNPLPDFKVRYLLARAAPDSEGDSLEDPAEG